MKAGQAAEALNEFFTLTADKNNPMTMEEALKQANKLNNGDRLTMKLMCANPKDPGRDLATVVNRKKKKKKRGK